mgnify:CR=1 FL=1|tara:strand:- start:588 stop:1001 length:414 start_codon:yes stop_codon:yes gene_type:complete
MNESLAEKIRAANETLIVDGDLDAVEKYFTPDYIAHITDRDMKSGHSTIQDTIGKLRRSFPDIQVDVEILLEGESRISWQRTMRGSLKNAYQGFPASGLTAVWRDMVTSQFRDGFIAEEWVLTDLAERLLLSRKTKK